MEKHIPNLDTSKEIPNFSNYLIFNNGKVYNKAKKKFQTIRNIPVGRGYQTVVISQDGKAKQFYLHKLVAEAFVKNPKPDEYDEVRFIDENSMNCNYTNLIWTNHQEACKIGRTGVKAKRTKKSKLGV